MNLPTYISGTVQTKAYAVLRENVYDVLGKYDINPTYWAMLGIILEAKDGVRQADIAKAMGVQPPLITVMVRDLVKLGYIQTVRNQFDARAKLLSISAEGKKFIKNVEIEMNKKLGKLLTGLTENDLIIYHKVLNAIIVNDSTNKKQVKNPKTI